MSQLLIGPYRYNVLKRDGDRLLLSWTETTGIIKERWIIFKNSSKVFPVDADK